jgi:hypothetical protein
LFYAVVLPDGTIVEPARRDESLSFFEWAFQPRRPKHVKKLLQSYERRMRVFNLGVIVIALTGVTILIVLLSTAWLAFEKSLGLTF